MAIFSLIFGHKIVKEDIVNKNKATKLFMLIMQEIQSTMTKLKTYPRNRNANHRQCFCVLFLTFTKKI